MSKNTFFPKTKLQTLIAHDRVFTLLAAFVIGMVSGLGAIGFRLLIEYFGKFFARFSGWSLQITGLEWLGIVMAPVVGGMIIGPIIYNFAREAKGHGVPEVMAAIIEKGGFIRGRVVWIKAVASAICISSGGSVGREGPIIQIGATIGSILGFMLHVPPRIMRTLVACGAAGGIAATFNAPIAGTLFAVEIILGDFGFIQLAPIVTSSVIATVVSRGIVGDFASFHVPTYALNSPLELLFYLGLGLLCGVIAVMFIRSLDFFENIFDNKIPIHEAAKPALGGLLIGLIGLGFPQIFGVGYSTIDEALIGQIPFYLLFALAAVKLLATTLTLSSGGSGGVFAPSLFMGSMLGGVVGKIANLITPTMTATSGAYSLVGMSAMVGAATHAPITAIVMIFELTNDYKIILPLMISTIIAVLTSNYLHKESIYTHKLTRKGIILDRGAEVNLLKKIKVADIMRNEYEKAPHTLPFNFLIDLLVQTARSRLPVVDDDERMLGVVSRELVHKFMLDRNMLSDMVIAKDVILKEWPVVLPGDDLELVTHRFNEFDVREVYVLDNMEQRQVIGMVRKGDLMDAYQQEMIKQAAGDTFAYGINRPHRIESVDVMEGYAIIEIEAPHDFSGKLLRDLDLRNRFGISILAIKRPDPGSVVHSKKVWVPDSGDSIMDGDVLVLLGETEKINEFQKIL